MTTQGDGRRGGYRKPARPAAVSGPQSGARTDGGPGDKQPMRVASGGAYGERKTAEAQQSAAPMASGGPSTPAGGPGGGAPAAPSSPGAFGPTQRPNESNAVGTQAEAMNPMAQNPQAFMRVLYSQFQHPAIARLVDWSSKKGNPRQ